MKLLLEQWRKFVLTESLALKPGPNGWELYGKLVAEAYKNAPLHDNEAEISFKALYGQSDVLRTSQRSQRKQRKQSVGFVDRMFDRISAVVDIQFVTDDPYSSPEEMCADAKQNGVLKIFRGGTKHPMFSEQFNERFRAVHDYMAHCQGHTNFTLQGEIAAFNTHTKTVPEAAKEALFTEVVGQAAYFLNYGEFPPQKIAILHGFDKNRLGVVDADIHGFVLDEERKELVEVQPSNKIS